MREIAPGLFQWSACHPGIRKEVCSYYFSEGGVLIDPLLPEEGFEGGRDPIEWLGEHGPPQAVLLSNRHHYRHSGRLVEAFGIPVRASRPGMHEFSSEQRVEPFDFGDELEGGVIAHEVDAICPDETALEIPAVRAIVIADGLVRWGASDDPIGFVPDWLLGDDPEKVRRGLLQSFERLLALDFEHLLLAHGLPVVGDGKERLSEFVRAASG
jgi:hypothetical protein